jgi:hypothetical protein
VITFRKLKNKS